MKKLFLTFFYVGLIPFAPGTFGTIAGAIIAYFVLKFLGVQTLALLCVLVFLAAINPINQYEKETNSHDNSHIVIDEVAGIWLTLSMCGFSLFGFILGIIYFRLFDIYKPSVIGRIDKEVKGGLGVMLDDILAGFFAGLATLITLKIFLYFGIILPAINS